MKSSRPAKWATETVQLRFLHISWMRRRPGGAPDITRRWNRWDCDPKTQSPGGAADQCGSAAPPGLGVKPTRLRWLGCAPPPANIRCASGAKTFVEALAGQFASLLLKRFLTAANRVIVLIL